MREIFGILFVFISVLGPSDLIASEPDPLGVYVVAESGVCTRGDDITFRVWIVNHGSETIRIPANVERFITPWAYNVLRNRDHRYECCGTPDPDGHIPYMELEAGDTYETIHTRSDGTPGIYTMWLRLLVPKLKANPDMWSGSIVSNKVGIQIER
jgi:hypothetical protein